MSKVDEFNEKITSDLTWRKLELNNLTTQIQQASGTAEKNTAIRCGICMLYAHWEGFIKNTALAYLDYIEDLRPKLKLNQLNNNLLSLALRMEFDSYINTKKATKQKEFLDKIRLFSNHRPQTNLSPIPNNPNKDVNFGSAKNYVKTDSNLSYEILEEMFTYLGWDLNGFTNEEDTINNLKIARNGVAHGEKGFIGKITDTKSFTTVRNKILGLLQTVLNLATNAVTLKEYEYKQP